MVSCEWPSPVALRAPVTAVSDVLAWQLSQTYGGYSLPYSRRAGSHGTQVPARTASL